MIKPTPEQIREKYFKMAKSLGYDEAITVIHNELGSLEPRVFDGGYDKDRFEFLQNMREIARELYTLKMDEASRGYLEKK